MSERTDAIAIAIEQNNDILRSINAAVDALNGEHLTIADELAALKEKIAAGEAPDLSRIEAAVAEAQALTGKLGAAIPANTEAPAEPPPPNPHEDSNN